MNKEQEQIIDEVYEKYSIIAGMSTQVITLTKEEFINKCKTDTEFSEKWGLKIQERELNNDERISYKMKKDSIVRTYGAYSRKMLDNGNIPTRLITITYNDKTIESYE